MFEEVIGQDYDGENMVETVIPMTGSTMLEDSNRVCMQRFRSLIIMRA